TNAYFVHGFMGVTTAPAFGETQYYITFYSTATLQESVLSDARTVIYSSAAVSFPTFHAARSHYNSFVDAGTQSTRPPSPHAAALVNTGAGKASPQDADFAASYCFSNAEAMPAGSYDRVRLWRQTATGIRLVKDAAATPGAAAGAGYTVCDD